MGIKIPLEAIQIPEATNEFARSINEALDYTPCFNYSHVLLDESRYAFNGKEFGEIDRKHYFNIARKISRFSVKELINLPSNKDLHFNNINNLESRKNEQLKKIVLRALNKKSYTSEFEGMLFKFALYTTDNENENSPRVYFILGSNGIFYILFIDLKHEFLSVT